MPEQITGTADVLDAGNNVAIHLDATGKDAVAVIGNSGHSGTLSLHAANGKENVRIAGATGAVRAGGNGGDGDLVLLPGNAKDPGDPSQASIHLGAAAARAEIGGGGVNGQCLVRDITAASRILLLAESGTVALKTPDGKTTVHLESGGAFPEGKIVMFNGEGKQTVSLSSAFGMMQIGGHGQNGQIQVLDDQGNQAVIISGQHGGDLVLSNADCAEDFDIEESCVPGSVVVIGEDGKLHPACEPYDRRVAGVLSGAGDYRPGLVLDRQGSSADRKPVALAGKVYCRVDARENPIDIGDLLTSSATSGHAMKAADPTRAFGAVIGKALRACSGGLGLIPILVALQ